MIVNNITSGNSSNTQNNSSQSPPVNQNVKSPEQKTESVIQDVPKNFQFVPQQNNPHIMHTIPILNTFPNGNELHMNQFPIITDPNMLNEHFFLNQPLHFAPTSQPARILTQQQPLRNDHSIADINNNFLFSFQQPPIDQINGMNNILTFPANCMNNVEFFNFYNNGLAQNGQIQWINNLPNNLTQMNPAQFMNAHKNDLNDRVRQAQSMMNSDVMKHVKPVFSYSCLIALALKNSTSGALPVNEIYKYMMDNFPYFRGAPEGWKNSVRHNLSLNKAFQKTKSENGNGTQRKGCLWSLKNEKRESMDVEIRKWFKKHPDAIRRSMSNPENFSHYFRNGSQDSNDEHSRRDSKIQSPKSDINLVLSNSSSGRQDNGIHLDDANRMFPLVNGIKNKPSPPTLNTIDPNFLNDMMTDIGSQIVDPWNPHAINSNFFPNLALIHPYNQKFEDSYYVLNNSKCKNKIGKSSHEKPN